MHVSGEVDIFASVCGNNFSSARHLRLGHNNVNNTQEVNKAVDSFQELRSLSSFVAKTSQYASEVTMFSPDAVVPTSLAGRNPRRRQRTSSEDSVAIRHNPKRVRRSVLNPETFKDPAASKLNGYLDHDEEAPHTNGHAKEPGSQRHESADTTGLAIRHRGVKKVDREKRAKKDVGTVELASDRAVAVLYSIG